MPEDLTRLEQRIARMEGRVYDEAGPLLVKVEKRVRLLEKRGASTWDRAASFVLLGDAGMGLDSLVKFAGANRAGIQANTVQIAQLTKDVAALCTQIEKMERGATLWFTLLFISLALNAVCVVGIVFLLFKT